MGARCCSPAHPYGKPIGGSETEPGAITRADVLQFYQQHFGADRLTLVFAGDFDPDEMRTRGHAAFAAWRSAARAAAAAGGARARAAVGSVLLVDAPGSAQTYFWIGNVGVARTYRAARRARDHQHRLRRQLRLDAHAGAARQERADLFGRLELSSWQRRRRNSPSAPSPRPPAPRRRWNSRSRLWIRSSCEGAGERAIASARSYILGPVSAGLRDRGRLGGGARGSGSVSACPTAISMTSAEALRGWTRPQSRQVIADAFPDSADVDIVLIGDAAGSATGRRTLGRSARNAVGRPALSATGPPAARPRSSEVARR